MATALIGVFEDIDAANAARTRLLQDGIGAGQLELRSRDQRQSAIDEEADAHRGFFARLFGLKEPNAHAVRYAEVVRGGSTVVTVHLADEATADRAARLLKQCGALDVDRHDEPWKAGYIDAAHRGDVGRTPPDPPRP